MFTGIVEEVGTVVSARSDELVVRASTVLEGTRLGDSIAVNGVCLTVVTFAAGAPGWFAVGLMEETLRRSNLGELRPGDRVNLERAMALGGRMGGHLVQGHIDGVGRVLSHTREREALRIRFSAPAEIMRYIVEKGFIAVDGASLTVAEVDQSSFAVSLVNFTQQHITLPEKRPGSTVNLEADIIGKYVERLLGARGGQGKVTLEFLAEHGFGS
ncbi:MAG: riboflavin synthase [Chloroflexota bacterium]|nr:MAG: riboflavin synthase [Chloroflexota bacterium]